jgi:hypothetical protein
MKMQRQTWRRLTSAALLAMALLGAATGPAFAARVVAVRTSVAYRPRPIARTAAVVGTAMVVGSVVASLPPSCSTMTVDNVTYQHCGSSWYRPFYAGTQVSYTVVNPPQ